MAEAPGAPSDPDGEDDPVRPPLPPEDRLWRHPSEAARQAGAATPRLFPAPPPSPPSGPRRRDLALAGVLGVVVGALAVTVGTAFAGHHHRPGADGHGSTPSTTAAVGAAGSGTAIVGAHLDDAVRALSPALVAIEAAGDGWARSGTGIAVGQSRFVLTALPVVAGARTLEVTTSRGVRVTARVVGTDPALGLALLEAPLPAPATAHLAAAPLPQVGTMTVTVAAAGSPGDPLLSVGAITTTETTAAVMDHEVGSLIETSAPLPAGGLGGALLGESGALEGIVLATSPSANGLVSLAVPISAVRQALPSLEAGSRPEAGWLGIDVALSTGTDSPLVVITRVTPGSPASAAGLRPGQTVLAVNGVRITGVEQLEAAIQAEPPGARIVLEIRTRSGRSTRLAVRLGHPPEPPPTSAAPTASGG
jgi:S1-C subfamily serine protease